MLARIAADVEWLTDRFILVVDARDVLAARDSFIRLLGLRKNQA
jgi:hypothetical protein